MQYYYLVNNEIVHHYLIYFLTYTYNYAWVKFKIPISEAHPFWSLCVEEQFYLFWPFVVLLLRKKSHVLLGLIVVIVLTGFLQKTLNIFPSLTDYNGAGLLTRMASLGLGAFGAIYSECYKLPGKIFASKCVEFFILLIVLPVSLIFYFKLNIVLLAFVSLFLVLKAAYFQFYIPKLDKLLQHKKILYIGAISYGIYVYHEPLIYYFNIYVFSPVWNSIDFGFFPLLKWQSWAFKGPIYLVITYVFASISFKYIERPILSLKNKWFKYKVTTGGELENKYEKDNYENRE